MSDHDPTCTAKSSASAKPCTDDGARFDIVYRTSAGAEIDRQPACFTHGLAQVERHHAAAGIAQADLVGPVRSGPADLEIPAAAGAADGGSPQALLSPKTEIAPEGESPEAPAGPFDQTLVEVMTAMAASFAAEQRTTPGYQELADQQHLTSALRLAERRMTEVALDLSAALEDRFGLALDKSRWDLVLALPAWRQRLQETFAQETQAGCVDRAFAAMAAEIERTSRAASPRGAADG